MEEESVGVTYNKLVVSKAGDFIVHMSHMVYFPKTNENRSSENDPLLSLLILDNGNMVVNLAIDLSCAFDCRTAYI